MALGAHKVVVELVATGQKAANEFRKVAVASEEVAVGSTAASGATGMLSSNMAKAGIAAATVFGAYKLGKSVVEDLVGSFTSAASGVRSFQRVTGASAETSSRFVFALNALGVSSDQTAVAVFQLGKKIGQGKINLEQYGVAVKKAKDGSTDIAGTVLNIADAYTKMKDPAKRSALAMEAFGRQGRNMLPFLARGREGIKELFDEAGRTNHIFSQEDLDQAKNFQLATHELGETFEGLKIKAGAALTPLVMDITEMTSSLIQMADAVGFFDAWAKSIQAVTQPFTDLVKVAKSFSDEIGLTESSTNKFGIAQKYLNDKTAEYSALVASGNENTAKGKALRSEISGLNNALGLSQDKVSKALETTAQKAEDADRALNTLKGTLFGLGDAQRGAQESLLRFQDAQAKAADAVDAYNDARAKGRGQDETEEAFQRRLAGLQRDVQQGYLDIASAHDDVAKAAVNAVTSQEAYDAAVRDPSARANLIAQLVDAKNKYGDTTGAIQAQIDKLNAWNATNPAAKNLTVQVIGDAEAVLGRILNRIGELNSKSIRIPVSVGNNGAAIGRFAGGGRPKLNEPSIVGENGPELFVPDSAGRILSHAESMKRLNKPAGVGASGGTSYNVNISTLVADASAGRAVVNAIKEYERGSGRSWRG